MNTNYFGKFKLSHLEIDILNILKVYHIYKINQLDFEINVVGIGGFNIQSVPKELRNYFHFYDISNNV